MSDGRFQKGVSGNKAGRPRGFAGVARMIAEATNDGEELVEWALKVWRNESLLHSHTECERAHAWLSDRMLGRPLQHSELVAIARVEHRPALPAGWSSMSIEDKRRFLDELELRSAKNANAAPLLIDAGDV